MNNLPKYTFYRKIFLFFLLFWQPLQSKPYETLFKRHLDEPRSSIKGIDAVYVINLDVRPEKWHRMEAILYYHNIDHSRFSAVFGKDFDLPIIQTFCTRHIGPGQLGVMLSHLSIYQDALKRGLSTIWVMEDDAEIRRNPAVLTSIIEQLSQLDDQWDILYTDLDLVNKEGDLVRTLALPKGKKRPFSYPLEYYMFRENVSNELQLIRARYGATSMIVSKRGMIKILEHFLTDDDILWPIDIEIHFIPGIRQYGLTNPVATNGHFPFSFSDTGKMSRFTNFYEINDEHVQYIESRLTFLQKISENWDSLFPSSEAE